MRRSRNRRPRLNRSPDKAVRAPASFVDFARVVHAPLPEIVAAAFAAGKLRLRRRLTFPQTLTSSVFDRSKGVL
ncbi:hypothetical protein YC2023_116439 [Brassica napus]